MSINTNQMLDVKSFCESNRICKGLFYELLKQGNGPRITKVGRRTLISPEAELDWRKQMEQQTTQSAA